jgi:2',3'-cyclic-nucleotide 2'-phosphodiesterase (5'-nucleotidase family)
MAVVGNHDYLNGPDALLDAYKSSKANFPLLGANFGSAGF